MLSVATLQFLLGMLDQQQVPVAHPNFAETAKAIIAAKEELVEALTSELRVKAAEPPAGEPLPQEG